ETAMGTFRWADPFLLEDQLTDEERLIRDAARKFAEERLLPRIADAYLNETVDSGIFAEFAEVDLLGATLPAKYGGSGANYVSYGLIAREIERIDSGYRSMMSVQASLVMYPIFTYGSEAQRQRYLPELAAGRMIGCFGLTEPDAGSDPSAMRTRAVKVPGGYRVTGSKAWI